MNQETKTFTVNVANIGNIDTETRNRITAYIEVKAWRKALRAGNMRGEWPVTLFDPEGEIAGEWWD